ncbi:multicopper oxidase domain-containing protein [Bradyrhizobium sp. 186]|uniref:multicopper oxidase domain-containing protein n=1 Tax=Bradyrhizobium sp. 186 TaxID=2782654 RepID=UPI002000E2B5|nr:multicopper oxidase domain-containing protein [Bradyrhizobium sp. 186]
MLTRRQFTNGSAAIVSGGLAGSLIGAHLAQGESVHFTRRLPIPPLIDAAKQGNAVKLKAASGRHAFIKGKPTHSYGYSGPVLGPAIRLRRGDEVEMTVENALDVDTTVHWHGLLVPGDVDGGPHQIIKSGGMWRPRLRIEQPASTAWFHPHLHHDTARQIYMGLTGLIIVDDGSDTNLGLPRTYGIDDLPIIIQDRSFDTDGSLLYDRAPDPQTIQYGSRGSTIIVNGVVHPVAQVPCSLVRLRILNAANAQNFDLRFSDGREFRVVASDAGFLSASVTMNQLRASPAERFEILVDFADRKPVMLETGPDTLMGIFGAVSPDGSGDFVSILRFEPTPAVGTVRDFPARLVEPATADSTKAVRRRQLVLDSGICGGQRPTEMGMLPGMCINGKTHDLARIDADTKLGTLEVWEIVSIGMAHPFHVHGASFRILSLAGAPPPAHLAGWKDVVLVEDKAELLVAFNRPATREHPFMYHCHILEHEDAGMMGQYVCA